MIKESILVCQNCQTDLYILTPTSLKKKKSTLQLGRKELTGGLFNPSLPPR